MLEAHFPENEAPSVEWIRSQYSYLSTIFSSRNSEYAVLRRVFDGDFASAQESSAKTGTPFKDRVSLIYNINNAAVRRYMDSMSAPPQIECVPEGFELEDLELADKRTKFLEYIYSCNNMPIKLMQSAYYQSLLDRSVWNVRPAPHLPHKIKIELGVPDFYYPITKGDDYSNPIAIIYGFRTYEDKGYIKDPMKFTEQDPQFNNIIECWTPTHFIRIEKYQSFAIKHDWGMIPWFETLNLPIPHRYRGQGDVDQAIGLNEYLNMLMSAMGDMIAYAAAPIAIVRGTKVGGTNLPFEPRAVWELERDAQAGFLQQSGAPPSVEAQILRTIQAIEDTTGVSSPAFGREIPSGTSGSAVRSLLAGFNTRLGTKQQLLGECLVKMNEAIQLIAEKEFPNEAFRIVGENVHPGKDLGRKKMYEVKPKEFDGWYRNRVVFSPMDPSQSYFQEVDKYTKGLQSRWKTMKAIGIQNVWDELERIKQEKQDELVHENSLALAKTGNFVPPSPEGDDGGLAALMEAIQGIPGASPRGLEQKRQSQATEAAALKPNAVGLLTGPNSQQEPAGVAQEAQPGIDLQAVIQRLKQAKNLTGRAAVSGGPTSPTIQLDNPADEPAVRAALGSDASRFRFGTLDREKPLPDDAIPFYSPPKSQKKNQVEIHKTPNAYLSVVVLGIKKTNNNAVVYEIGVIDAKGAIIPVGKTNPHRSFQAEQGEIIRIEISSISRKDDGTVRYGLGTPTPVKAKAVPARPSSMSDIEKIFEKNQ